MHHLEDLRVPCSLVTLCHPAFLVILCLFILSIADSCYPVAKDLVNILCTDFKYLNLKQIYEVLRVSNRLCIKMLVVRNTQDLHYISSSVKGPRTSTFCNLLRYSEIQNNLVRDPSKKYGPRTTDFCNNLSFSKIRIWLVRGPLSRPSSSDSSLCSE